ncbi:MAG: N-acetyl-anhydromuranmyl-L-alanine amidase [Thaumarchaeota archaeon]|nr:N-acetyl-anhydromuranmyl-L-alanine amidase [Nitrososphaerota archaeon]|tara:strand:- start:630 stop:926 length:297 start_codon:yes stop_codon:yes gene_type:complete
MIAEYIAMLPDGLIFGFVDNSLLLIGAYTGVSIEKFLNKQSSGVLGGVLGATIGNAISDGAGALIDPTMNGMFAGIVVGALIPILFIPLIERIRNANT